MAKISGLSKYSIYADPAGSGSNIKSVQHGMGTLSTYQTSVSITLNEVDVSKTAVIISCRYTSGSEGICNLACTGFMSNSTTLRIQRYSTDVACYFAYQVIEFANIKSLQTGEKFSSGTGNTSVNFSEVDMSKSIFFISKRTTNSQTDARYISTREYFTSPSSIAVVNGASSDWYYRWYVVEFY